MIILFNEIPEPIFEIIRSENYSENVVTLDGSQTVDPEGDNLEIDLILVLMEYYNGLMNLQVMYGKAISQEAYTIEMRVTDNAPEHVETYKVSSVLIQY